MSDRKLSLGKVFRVGIKMVPRVVHVLNTGTCESFLLWQKKKDFSDEIKARILKWEAYSGLSNGPFATTRVLTSERGRQ